jgi:hypothetical protein
MRPIASRIARALAVAAVPVLIAGCSGSSDSNSSGSSDKSTPKVKKSAAPSLAPAKYTALPNPCKVLSKGTVTSLVPATKDAAGDAAQSSDTSARASCSWNGLDGFQYHWLDVAFRRSDSGQGIGSAEEQAKTAFAKLRSSTARPDGLKKGQDPSVREAGLGDESQLVSAEVEKDKETYRDVTVVVRRSNVTLTVSYDGAGFEDGKDPAAKEIEAGALKAAREALAKVR